MEINNNENWQTEDLFDGFKGRGEKVLKFKKILNNQRLLSPNFIATKSPHSHLSCYNLGFAVVDKKYSCKIFISTITGLFTKKLSISSIGF